MASVITKAVDRKSVVLFVLVLVVCVLFLGNAVAAAVRDRAPSWRCSPAAGPSGGSRR